jgi:hypothetical protein
MDAGLRPPLLDFFRRGEVARKRSWMKSNTILSSLVKNPKTPVAASLTLVHRLNDRDVRSLSIDRNLPGPLRIAARKKVAQGR